MNKNTLTFDAIVIGSGITGGWAAKELCEKGLKTLVLERGRDIKHIKDYPTANKMPWEFDHRGAVPLKIQQANPVAAGCYAFNEDDMHFFANEKEHPYIQDKPYDWIRGYQVGGKSLTWARHTQRWSDFDFDGPIRDGFGFDWPIRYKDIEPWYSHVEKFVGICGNKDGIPHLPDGEFLPPMDLTCVEQYFKESIAKNYSDRQLIHGRTANLSKPNDIHLQQGRGICLKRDLCQRGCPYGAYFSSNSSTLPWAEKTGNYTLRPFSVVHSIMYDDSLGKATGVRVIDTITKEIIEYESKIVFVNGSALNSILILMNSISKRFPNGMGNDSGLLGKYIMYHNFRGRISAECDDFKEFTTEGRRPTTAYIPRFQNVHKHDQKFLRGYAAGLVATRAFDYNMNGVGEKLISQLNHPVLGPWGLYSWMMGEVIPREENFVYMDKTQKDSWNIPLLRTSVDYGPNEMKMIDDFHEQFTEMFTKAGFKNIKTYDTKQVPGQDTHEMGGARMGNDPKTSVLNKWNQVHSCKNVFVTDGACMTSSATQNPSLTYMALTARAAAYAVEALKNNEL